MPRLYLRHPAPRIAAFLVLLACVFVPAAGAQLWQGPAALEVRAEGKGASVAGGTVELVYLALDPPAGPPPVALDSRGRAVVGGLAEGMWRVSVSREGYMTYQAEVDVRRDEKPELVATFQQNVPGAVHMMKVKLARAKPSGPAAPPPPPQIAERLAPRPVEPPPAPVQEPAPPAEEPVAAPAPAPQPVQPEPQPAPPVSERPEPSTQAPPIPAPRPTPAPAPPVEPSVDPVPAPAPPAAPGGSVRHRSFADRTCYECKPGEASLSVERVVSAGVGCGPGVRDMVAQSGEGAALPEGCSVLRLTLPAGSRYTGYRYEVQDRSGSVDCMAGRDCPGGGRWPADPALARAAAGTTVSAAFENLGAGDDRRAVLTVYYTAGEAAGDRRP